MATERILNKIDEIESLKPADLESADVNFLLNNVSDLTEKSERLLQRWVKLGNGSGRQQIALIKNKLVGVAHIADMTTQCQDFVLEDETDKASTEILVKNATKYSKVGRFLWAVLADLAAAGKLRRSQIDALLEMGAPRNFTTAASGSKPASRRSKDTSSDDKPARGRRAAAAPDYDSDVKEMLAASPREARNIARKLAADRKAKFPAALSKLITAVATAAHSSEVKAAIAKYNEAHGSSDDRPTPRAAKRVEVRAKAPVQKARRKSSDDSSDEPSDEDMDRRHDRKGGRRLKVDSEVEKVFGKKVAAPVPPKKVRVAPHAPAKVAAAIRSVRRPRT